MKPKVISLLGIARRAGKVFTGESQVEALLKKGKGSLLVIAEDSPGAYSKFKPWAEDLKIPVIRTGCKQELGLAVGQSPRSIILIDDKGFAEAILKENRSQNSESRSQNK